MAESANAVSPFNFGTHTVRVILRDGEPWFVCTDVALALGYRDAHNASRYLDDDEKGILQFGVPHVEKGGHNLPTPGGEQRVTIINESGLYTLVLRSRKPEARKFAKWVTSEELPAIRKTGAYAKVGAGETATPTLTNRRWLISFDHDGRELVTPVPDDACVMTHAQMLKALVEPNGLMVKTADLAEFAVAAIRRLQEICEFHHSKGAGKQVSLRW